MIVSRQALNSARRKGKPTKAMIDSISKNNQKAFEERPEEKVSGLADPKTFLKMLADENKKSMAERKHRGQSELDSFGKEVQRVQRTNIMSTEEERIGENFRKILKENKDDQERKNIRKFLGWKHGFDFHKAGFTWNPSEKRWEKEVVVENVKMVQWIKIKHIKDTNRSSSLPTVSEIEYGYE